MSRWVDILIKPGYAYLHVQNAMSGYRQCLRRIDSHFVKSKWISGFWSNPIRLLNYNKEIQAAFSVIPGRMDPVSWYLLSILETHPWLTRSWREMTQGRTPAAAISMILRRMWLGSGRPLMNTPPNWFTRPCPVWMGEDLCRLSKEYLNVQ